MILLLYYTIRGDCLFIMLHKLFTSNYELCDVRTNLLNILDALY